MFIPFKSALNFEARNVLSRSTVNKYIKKGKQKSAGRSGTCLLQSIFGAYITRCRSVIYNNSGLLFVLS